MNVGRQLVVSLVISGLFLTVSCAKTPPQLPQQAKVPAEPLPSSLPVEISEETPPPPPPPPPQQEEPAPAPPQPKQETHHKKKRTQPPANTQNNAPSPPAGATASTTTGTGTSTGTNPSPAPSTGNTTVAATHPPANPAETPADVAIGADVSTAQLTQQKQTTAQLLDDTEKTLNGLSRQLSHDEESIVTQIRSYMAQSVTATKEGDFERAYNLANKAHLLSAALVKK
jgi:hypothetical protein